MKITTTKAIKDKPVKNNGQSEATSTKKVSTIASLPAHTHKIKG